jgi:hypothetical protein
MIIELALITIDEEVTLFSLSLSLSTPKRIIGLLYCCWTQKEFVASL